MQIQVINVDNGKRCNQSTTSTRNCPSWRQLASTNLPLPSPRYSSWRQLIHPPMFKWFKYIRVMPDFYTDPNICIKFKNR